MKLNTIGKQYKREWVAELGRPILSIPHHVLIDIPEISIEEYLNRLAIQYIGGKSNGGPRVKFG